MKATFIAALLGLASCSDAISKSSVDLQGIIEHELLQVDSDSKESMEAREDAMISQHFRESMDMLQKLKNKNKHQVKLNTVSALKTEIDTEMEAQLEAKVSELARSVQCVQECQWKSWSFRNGLQLQDSCPNDCSLAQLQGIQPKIDGKTARSRLAEEAIDDDRDVKNYRKNLATLK